MDIISVLDIQPPPELVGVINPDALVKLNEWMQADQLDKGGFHVPFDEVATLAGYEYLSSAKRKLVANFVEGKDFATTLLESTGGRPREAIRLTVDAFKSFCMMAPTATGKLVRFFYIHLEKEVYRRWQEQLHRTHATRQIEWPEKEAGMVQSLALSSTIHNSGFDNESSVVYIGAIGICGTNQRHYKFGESRQYQTRMSQHKSKYGTYETLRIWKCENRERVEMAFKRRMESLQLLRRVDVEGEISTEVFVTDEQHPLETCIFIMDSLVLELGKSDDVKALELRHEIERKDHELEKERLQHALKMKDMEHKVEMLELQRILHQPRAHTRVMCHKIDEYFNRL